ncbi:MAG: hypothetical protein WCK15_11900 [Pirellula sp.]
MNPQTLFPSNGSSHLSGARSTNYARHRAIVRDQRWALNAAHREGEIKGEIKGEIELIRTLEGILGLALSNVEDLQKLDLADLQSRTSNLQDRARNRA